MSEMVERVTRAICMPNNADRTDACCGNCGSIVDRAKAAIEAMREPTEAMLEKLRKQGGIDGYQAMIDAALNSP